MPQLDFVTYLDQFQWLFVVFMFFYLFVLSVFFPSISSALKVRTKKVLREKKDLANIESEEVNSLIKYESVWEKSLKIQQMQLSYIKLIQTSTSLS